MGSARRYLAPSRELEAPRAAAPEDGADQVRVVRFECDLDPEGWGASFTRDHPELFLRIHGVTFLRDSTVLTDFEVLASSQDWSRELSRCPGVLSVACLDVSSECGHYRVVHRATPVLTLAAEHQILLRYPASAHRDRAVLETVDRVSRVRRFIDALRAGGHRPRVVSLSAEPNHGVVLDLTPIQLDTFHRAFAAGYYEVPRRITLTGLSHELMRSKSSVSVTLANVEKKLAEAAMNRSDRP
jgi:hypothetical protein